MGFIFIYITKDHSTLIFQGKFPLSLEDPDPRI